MAEREPDYTPVDGRVRLEIAAPHMQVIPFYPSYRTDRPSAAAIEDYRHPGNCCGHTQRALLCYWAMRAFEESNGGIGLDLGGAGVVHPGCLSVDIVGQGEINPDYGGSPYTGVHLKADAMDLSMFGAGTFSCVLSSHLLEHAPCELLRGGEPAAQKAALRCPGLELVPILRGWLRVLRPSGVLVAIMPDQAAAEAVGLTVFDYDNSHQHSPDSRTFRGRILSQLDDLATVEQYGQFSNRFSFEIILRKR